MQKVVGPRVIVALDFSTIDTALACARRLDPRACRVKVGKELFTRAGPRVVEQLTALGFETFLDLKFHDIPHTVARACAAAADLGVWMLNVHASGGSAMLSAAREALDKKSRRPLLIAVTVLTSLSEAELHEIGFSGDLDANVGRLARLTQQADLDGVVCSAREAAMLRAQWGPSACLVTPGIRPRGAATHDQTRVMTPAEAVGAGVSYLVIGRPITEAADPAAVLAAVNAEIAAV